LHPLSLARWLSLKRAACQEAIDQKKEEIETNMGKVRRLVLDVLKPLEPTIIQLAQQLSGLSGVEAVNISIYEIDRRVENAKITIEGDDLSYENIDQVIQENGGTVHSIDEVVAGKIIIEDAETLQD